MVTFFRYLDMLSLIPTYPETITPAELVKELDKKNYKVDIRSVQRDLVKLSEKTLFPFTCDSNKPSGWFWPEDSIRLQFPVMTSNEALTFKLVDQFLDPLIPPAIKTELAPYFKLAENTLKKLPAIDWYEKVRIVPTSQSLIPARIDPAILQVVYDALFRNMCFSASYHPKGKEVKEYEIHPLGLVLKGASMYLVLTHDGESKVKQMLLHRFINAKLLYRDAVVPSGFNLDSYIRKGGFDYPEKSTKLIPLKIKVCAGLHTRLSETRLSLDQTTTPLEDNHFCIHANVLDTLQLRWWLHSYAEEIEILEPIELRNEFAESAMKMFAMYAK